MPATRLFKPSSWLVTVDFIKRLMFNEPVLMVVLSSPRSGKSSFVKLLEEKLSTMTTHVSSLQGDQVLSSDALSQKQDAEKRTLLVLDDAHLLPQDALLSFIQSYQAEAAKKPIYLCLVADTAFTETLLLPAFKQGVHTMTLGALTEAETKTYALHLLKERNPLHARHWQAFYARTTGAIEAIHREIGTIQGKTARVLTRFPQRTVWIGMVGILLTFAYFYSMQLFLADSTDKPLQLSQKSLIPSYVLGAKRHRVYPEPKSVPMVLTSEVQAINMAQHPIVDRVIFIPKGGQVT